MTKLATPNFSPRAVWGMTWPVFISLTTARFGGKDGFV